MPSSRQTASLKTNPALINAVKKGDAQSVSSMLQQGANTEILEMWHVIELIVTQRPVNFVDDKALNGSIRHIEQHRASVATPCKCCYTVQVLLHRASVTIFVIIVVNTHH